MKKVTIALFVVMLAGCGSTQGGFFGPGDFTINKTDSRFSETDSNIYTSSNNRISSKSIAGGTHIDDKGVFLNPAAVKNEEGVLKGLYMQFINLTGYDTSYGSPNRLGVIQSVSFVTDEQRAIVRKVSDSDSEWLSNIYYNSVSKSASSDIVESGRITLSLSDYKKIMSAESLAVKITGDKRSVVYEQEDISPSFKQNLKTFFEAHLK